MTWTERHPDVARLQVPAGATLMDALRVLDQGAQQIVFVVDEDERVLGSLTDGDVRRMFLKGAGLEDRVLREAMAADFARVGPETGRAEVLDLMRARHIEQVPVLDVEGRLCGLHTVAHMLAHRERPNAALLLAGGRGTRLRPLTETLPKPMVCVGGRPILERLVLHLMSHGIRRIYLSVNYLADVIEDHFGDGSALGCQIEYLREEKPMGTGGALSLLDDATEHPLLVLNGDLVTQADLGRLLAFHEDGGYAATFGLRPYEVEIPYGVAAVEEGRLVDLEEKPTHRMLINAGLYVLSREVVELVPSGSSFPITDLWRLSTEAGLSVGAHVVEDDWMDIGRPEELRKANGRG